MLLKDIKMGELFKFDIPYELFDGIVCRHYGQSKDIDESHLFRIERIGHPERTFKSYTMHSDGYWRAYGMTEVILIRNCKHKRIRHHSRRHK